MTNPMNERSPQQAVAASGGQPDDTPKVLVVGPDGIPIGAVPGGLGRVDDQGEPRELPVTEMVEQPAKVMRIGSMIKQLLEEVRAAPLDEASRARLKDIHASSIKELELGLAQRQSAAAQGIEVQPGRSRAQRRETLADDFGLGAVRERAELRHQGLEDRCVRRGALFLGRARRRGEQGHGEQRSGEEPHSCHD